MKLIKVILKPERAIVLKDELQSMGFHGITSKESHGFGETKVIKKQIYRGRVYEERADAVKRVELELVAPDERLEDVKKIVEDIGKTGTGGDGRLYISTLDEALHIHSGTTHFGDSSEEETVEDI